MPGDTVFSSATRPPLDLFDGEWEDDAHSIRRVAAALDGGLEVARSSRDSVPEAAAPARRAGSATRPSAPGSGAVLLAWFVLSLGLLTFVFGGTLLGWACAAGRNDLWAWGLPLTLGGQCVLLIGVVLLVDSLWQSHRRTSAALDDFDTRLEQLHQAAVRLAAAHSASSRSFYIRLAEGASPQTLLADVQGQLDMLARNLARERSPG